MDENLTGTSTEPAAENNSGLNLPPEAHSEAAQDKPATGKTFSQEELDAILKDRLQRERKNIPSKEELAAFKAWKDEQKTAEQKNAEKFAEMEKKAAEAERKAAEAEAKAIKFEQRELLRKANVDEKFISYVSFEVSESARKNETQFDEELARFLKANADTYTKKEQGETRMVTIDTGAAKPTQAKDEFRLNFAGVRPRK